MYRVMFCGAALLVAAVQPATADGISVCKQATGDDAIAACIRVVALNPKNPNAYAKRSRILLVQFKWLRIRKLRERFALGRAESAAGLKVWRIS